MPAGVIAMPEQNDNTAIYRIDDLQLDTRSRNVTRGGVRIDLPKLSFDLFLVLIRATPSVVSINDLVNTVWGDVVVGDETVTQRVKMLRDALGETGDKQRYIETVRGVGYRLRPTVTIIDGEAEFAGASGGYQRDARFWWAVVSIVVIVVLTTTSIFYLRKDVPDHASIAVLPFVAMSDAADDEYFADGVTEEVLNSLAQLPDLLVTARTSSFYFKGQNIPVQEIAASLGVAHILEGSIRRDGNRVRITAQLVRGDDGFHMWSETIEHTSNDTFAVQINIAEKVANALEVVLDDAQRRLMQDAGVRDPRAFIAYQKGVFLYEQAHGASQGLQQLVQANRYFAEAIELAPRFSNAYAKHSDYFSHVLLSLGAGVDIDSYQSGDIAEVNNLFSADMDAAIRYAPDERQKRLLALDKAIFTGAWQDLDQQIVDGLAEPGCATSTWLETVALPFGYAADSRALVERWIKCDPLNFEAHMHRVRMLAALGEFERLHQASVEALQVIEHPLLRVVQILALIGMDKSDDAEALIKSRPGDEVMQIGGSFWLAAAHGDSVAARESLTHANEVFGFSPGDQMAYQALVGNREEVNRIAASADAKPFGHMVLVTALLSCSCGPVFDLEVTPNFARMIEEAGLKWPPAAPLDWPLKTW